MQDSGPWRQVEAVCCNPESSDWVQNKIFQIRFQISSFLPSPKYVLSPRWKENRRLSRVGSEFHGAYRSRAPWPLACLTAVILVDEQQEKHRAAWQQSQGPWPPGCPTVLGAGAVYLYRGDEKCPWKVSFSTSGSQAKSAWITVRNLRTER